MSQRIRSQEEMQRVANCLRMVIWSAFAIIGAYLSAINGVTLVAKILLVGTALFQLYAVFRLARALELSVLLLVARCLLCLIPTICLINLVSMISDAKEVLRRGV